MRKFLPIFLSSLIFTSLLFVYQSNSTIQKKSDTKIKTVRQAKSILPDKPQTAYAQEIQPEYFPAVSLSIPKINLSANVISVGLDSQGRMDVPNNFVEVGWYNLGYKPGEKGSVVLDGHHDDFNGNPAVFYNLSQLQAGDQILVTDQTGKQFTYIVSGSQVYPYDQLPLQEIFATNDMGRLNLITCEGTWDSARGDYSHRTVVYSQLQTP